MFQLAYHQRRVPLTWARVKLLLLRSGSRLKWIEVVYNLGVLAAYVMGSQKTVVWAVVGGFFTAGATAIIAICGESPLLDVVVRALDYLVSIIVPKFSESP